MAANLRKRRGVLHRSITQLGNHVSNLKETADQSRTLDCARQLLTKLQTLDSDFRTFHLELINLIDEANTEALDTEQELLKLDDDVSGLTVRPEALTNLATPPAAPVALTRNLAHVETGLNCIEEAIAPTDTPVERTLLSQYQKAVSDSKKDIVILYEKLITKNIADDELFVIHSAIERQLSSTSYKIKSLLVVPPTDTPTPTTTDGTRGNIIHWKQFWDQFTNTEKTVHLLHTIKDGSARNAIEGLSQSGDNHEEALECLESHYNTPRLIQRTYVQLIVDTPPLKEVTRNSGTCMTMCNNMFLPLRLWDVTHLKSSSLDD